MPAPDPFGPLIQMAKSILPFAIAIVILKALVSRKKKPRVRIEPSPGPTFARSTSPSPASDPETDQKSDAPRERQPTERWLLYQQYMQSDRWKALRKQALERDNHRCRACDHDRAYNLEVHHRRYPERFGTETVEDLTTLCRRCHKLLPPGASPRRT